MIKVKQLKENNFKKNQPSDQFRWLILRWLTITYVRHIH